MRTQDAGSLILEATTEGFTTEVKGANDLVTEIDHAVENFVRALP